MSALTFSDNSNLSDTDDARLSRIEAALPVSVAGTITYSNSNLSVPAASSVLSTGQISPSLGIQSSGNVFAFVVQGNFGFSYSGNSLTIYWDGTNGSAKFVVRRADGTNLSIPPGSFSITGLSVSTQYGFAPFIAVAQPQAMSFVVGDSGSPRYAFSPSASATVIAMANQTQRLSVNESITNGLIYFTTPASGGTASGGGTGGYTGSPSCTARGTKLLTSEGWMINDEVYRRWHEGTLSTLTGRDEEEKIVDLKWVSVNSGYLVKVSGFEEFRCSESHNICQYPNTDYGPIRAVPDLSKVTTSDGWKVMQKDQCGPLEVLRVTLAGPSHEYSVAGGVWTHNTKADPSGGS